MPYKNALGFVTIMFIVIGLCLFVGFLSWGPNMNAESIGFFGVVIPVLAVIAAFMFGVGTGLTMDVGPDMDHIEL